MAQKEVPQLQKWSWHMHNNIVAIMNHDSGS